MQRPVVKQNQFGTVGKCLSPEACWLITIPVKQSMNVFITRVVTNTRLLSRSVVLFCWFNILAMDWVLRMELRSFLESF